MFKTQRFMVAALAAVFLMAAGCSQKAEQAEAAKAPAASSSAGAVFAASFKDLDDKVQPLRQWQGKVMVLNFWAPWCPPCREEMPDFIKLQDKYRERGLIFVGVALDEKIKVQAFVDEMAVNYPILLGEMEAVDLAKKLGNRLGGLPFTVVIDRNGGVVASEVGGLTQERLEKLVLPLL